MIQPLPATPTATPLPITADQAREGIRAAIATLVAAASLQSQKFRIFYRGLNYNRTGEPPPSWLFVSEDLGYAAAYAVTDPVASRIDPAIAVYVMLEGNFFPLRQSAQILTNRDYRRMQKGLPLEYLSQATSREWVFSQVAQNFLFGPLVIRIPINFKG